MIVRWSFAASLLVAEQWGDDFSIENFASEDSSKRCQFDKVPITKPDTIYTVSNLETYG